MLIRGCRVHAYTLAALLLICSRPRAEEPPEYDYYDHYDAGYGGTYDQNDWFFDYYAYEYVAARCDYDYFTGYSYEMDSFDWEQPGLFGPARAEAPRNGGPRKGAAQSSRQTGAFSESAAQARARGRKLRQVSGEIFATKLVDVRGTTTRNLVVLLQTDRGHRRLIADLGPVRALRETEANPLSAQLDVPEDLELHPGRRIELEGVVERIQDTQFLIARRIRQGEQTAIIRRPAQISQAKDKVRLPPVGAAEPRACDG